MALQLSFVTAAETAVSAAPTAVAGLALAIAVPALAAAIGVCKKIILLQQPTVAETAAVVCCLESEVFYARL